MSGTLRARERAAKQSPLKSSSLRPAALPVPTATAAVHSSQFATRAVKALKKATRGGGPSGLRSIGNMNNGGKWQKLSRLGASGKEFKLAFFIFFHLTGSCSGLGQVEKYSF